MKILVTGGTGFIGANLVSKLRENYSVNILSRKRNSTNQQFFWDYKNKQIDEEAIDGVEGVIHLAGATVSKRWTKKYKQEIYSSRVDSLQFLGEALSKRNSQLKFLISASGVNYYGTQTTEKVYSEEDDVGEDFLAQICKSWEEAVLQFPTKCERKVILRTGIVLSNQGGAMQQMLPIFKKGLGANLGSGKQIMPCISLEDMVHLYSYALENELDGIYNGVAFNCTNDEFSTFLARSLGKRKLPIEVPSIVLRIVFGEMSEILLKGSAIDNEKILATGYPFSQSTLQTLRV